MMVSGVCVQSEGLVLSPRDLFQGVFEMKKKEVEEAKKQKDDDNKDDNKENEGKEQAQQNASATDTKVRTLTALARAHLVLRIEFYHDFLAYCLLIISEEKIGLTKI